MKKQNHHALWLVKEGDHTLLKMEVEKDKWVTLIKEYSDAPFSHIIEPLGIEEKINGEPNSINPSPST